MLIIQICFCKRTSNTKLIQISSNTYIYFLVYCLYLMSYSENLTQDPMYVCEFNFEYVLRVNQLPKRYNALHFATVKATHISQSHNWVQAFIDRCHPDRIQLEFTKRNEWNQLVNMTSESKIMYLMTTDTKYSNQQSITAINFNTQMYGFPRDVSAPLLCCR